MKIWKISGITAGSILAKYRPIDILIIYQILFSIMSANNIGTPRPELGEYIYALPFERHIIYFIQSVTEVIVIRILSQNQDAGKHVNWL